MTALDEIRKMQRERHSDEEIVTTLRGEGYNPNEIYDALSQSKIKEAVIGTTEAPPAPVAQEQMQPSISEPVPVPTQEMQAPSPTQEMPAPAPGEEVYAPAPSAYGAEEGYYSQAMQGGVSSETISEISEQIVDEKLASISDKLKKSFEMKTKFEAKVDQIEERLKRIELIIDRLQLSVLQKVGEYVTNVEDIRREVIETQKSFKSLLPEKKEARRK